MLLVVHACRPAPAAPPSSAAPDRVGRIMATFHQGDVGLFDGDVLTVGPLRAEVIAEGAGVVVVDALYGTGALRLHAPSALPAATPRSLAAPPAWTNELPAGARVTLRAASCPTTAPLPAPTDAVVDDRCGVDMIHVTAPGTAR
jgi:hypothetical protein